MKNKSLNLAGSLLGIGSMVFCAALATTPVNVFAAPQDPAPDNTKVNKYQAPTADQQKNNLPDRTITQQIRKSIHADTSLSTYAHNIKIITANGKVTLRGPVRSQDEKDNLQAKAVAVAGDGNVTNEIEIAPSK